ncbi:MAG: hypothetical protein LCH84_18395, partial [Gemmatimonadetes bacterium]|nr:hypothetical protein [Gemmatimonadota bacterium]
MTLSFQVFSLPTELRFLAGAVDLLCESHRLVRHASSASLPTVDALNDAAAFLVTSGRFSATESSSSTTVFQHGHLVLRSESAPVSSVWTAVEGVSETGATVQLFRRSDALAAGSVDESPETLIPELCRQFYHLGW